ncbi:MAG: glycosyltransferase family 2 protein [Chitinophagaceae bacterium]|nr:glycosyltransferase family 2 protein [Polaromonas sp.]
MKISFIVLTYNRCDALLAVLRSLAAQCSADHEVLVADDGSTPAQVDMLYKNCPAFRCSVRHVWHPDTGFTAAAARNLGAHNAKGDYLVFLDGDCVPGKSFVAAHTLLARRGLFVNGSRVLLSERLTARVVEQSLDLPAQSAGFWWMARLQGDSNKLLHMLYWPWSLFRVKQGFEWRGIRSCNLGVWRSDFVAVNGFDETFEGWGHEDADLVLRLSHFGVQRKNGFLATEVFHLRHQESVRSQALANQKKVMGRIKTNLVRAVKGLSEIPADVSVKVTTLY